MLHVKTINKYGHIEDSLKTESVSTFLKNLKQGLRFASIQKLLSGHSFRVGTALDHLEQGK